MGEWPVVSELEVFVRELRSVDGLSACTIPAGEITALKHEIRNHTAEAGTGTAEAFLARAEGTEVFDSLGNDVVVQLEIDSSQALPLLVDPVNCGPVQVTSK
ncbi:uncharacterized protein MYCGRDRAFT_92050 [Zymoseptoria tritici IPO323]|uniref:Uncharacterized protein n=1 Tax=Zymoseptoria tritici (strain CBS 115943 / IPO323) TaxID=336722 RepID=F9X5X5_ZYMTI|nr:uncharacterized protein MYCGRDRAFT_92050 [Zymoseptoria tritici IPO323]EGP89020.1 hypothetical protein MYCGRDRAFT_92050 [Zymoseptoria tritici IPO323]